MTEFTLIIGNKNYSSWSLRPWLVMKHLEVPFDEIVIPLYRPGSEAMILQYSPSGRVPVLLHRGITIWDSLAICEYLAEQVPASQLWPADPAARAAARSVSAEMHSGFQALRQNMPMDLRASRPDRQVPEQVMREAGRIAAIWKECRARWGRPGNFLFGKFTIADAMYAPVVSRFTTYSVKLDPVAERYCAAIWELPAMQEWSEAARAEPWTIEG